MNIDSFYLNSAPLSPAGYLPLELDAITKSEMAPDRANRLDWREHSRDSSRRAGAISDGRGTVGQKGNAKGSARARAREWNL